MKKIAIIGAGISGLFFANLIEKNKYYSYKIFERKNSIDLNDGYGIQLSVNSIKLSNMNMKIIINKNNDRRIIKNGFLLDKSNFSKFILPSFTKKIFKSLPYFK